MIYLQAPYNSPTFQVILKNPEMQDNVILDVKSLYYRAMNGNIVGLKKTPTDKIHRLTFVGLTRRKALEVLKFIKDVAGLEVKYIDRESQTWKGIITTAPFEIETTGLGRGAYELERKEANVITLDFKGVQI